VEGNSLELVFLKKEPMHLTEREKKLNGDRFVVKTDITLWEPTKIVYVVFDTYNNRNHTGWGDTRYSLTWEGAQSAADDLNKG